MSETIKKIELLEKIVKTPLYFLVGYTSKKLIYMSTQEGIITIYSYDIETSKSLRLAKEPVFQIAKTVKEVPLVIYTRDVSKGKELQKLFYYDLKRNKEDLFADFEPLRIFGLAFDGNKVAFTGITQTEISLYLSKKDKCEKITNLNTFAFVTDLNEKYAVGFGNLKFNPRTSEIFFVNLSTNELKIYTPKEGSVNKAPIVKDSEIIFESNFEGKNKLYSYKIEEDKIEEVKFSNEDYYKYNPTENIEYDYLEDKIWVLGKKNGKVKLFLDGKEIKTPEGFLSSPEFLEKKIYVTYSSLTSPWKILEINKEKGDSKVLLASKVPEEIKDKFEVKFITYKSFDGLEIPAYLIENKNIPKPGPTLVYVHGGPWSEVADFWSILEISLASLGFHLILPNFRGSTGYGEEFRNLDIGDPGGGDLKDIVYSAKWTFENKIASEIGIIGYSYGGYMTTLALGKEPDLWKCGIAGAAVVDWEEMYKLSDAIFRTFIDILFENKKEILKERSPISYVKNIKVPLCLIQPQNDTRTPLKPVLNYTSKLLEENKTFELHVTPDMGHIVTKIEDIYKILLPAVIFLDKYFK